MSHGCHSNNQVTPHPPLGRKKKINHGGWAEVGRDLCERGDKEEKSGTWSTIVGRGKGVKPLQPAERMSYLPWEVGGRGTLENVPET